jgi:Disulphide bond corrector protein DsbC
MRLLSASVLMSAILLPSCVPGHSQLPTDIVQWRVDEDSSHSVHRGAISALRVDAHIKEGWHVYGSAQLEGGPTPLKASLEENPIASLSGKIDGSEPLKLHDTSFNLETTAYKTDFFLTIPVRLKSDAPSGVGAIPVSIRYQSCSDRTCMPPKTIHLRIPVSVVATR